MSATYTRQTITARTDWLPGKLFSLRATRPPAFRFQAGQFARLGLPETEGGEPTLWRAYSMVSGPGDDWLEFYSVVVPEGAFSPRLARLQAGDSLYVEDATFGFLTLDRFADGEDLWLIASGTGLSAYLSMLDEASLWAQFRRVILVHGVRTGDELAYQAQIEARRAQVGADRLRYLPIASREALPGAPQARLTTLLEDGRLEQLAGLSLDAARSRVMLCGNPGLLTDARALLKARGFLPGRRGVPGNLAVENYW